MSTRARVAIVASAGLVLMLAAPLAAQQTVKREAIKPIANVSGTTTFREYCTVCHGTGGKGDGPAATALSKPPADLTQIAKRNGGKFSGLAVRMTITGDTTVAAHGTRDMPVWGPLFRSVENDQTAAVRLKNVVAYIQNMQEK